MTSSAAAQAEPAPISACTISRDVQNFDLLIEDMETALGEAWGDLPLNEAAAFLTQLESGMLEFVALALDSEDEDDLATINEIIAVAKERKIKIVIIAEDVTPGVLHQLLRQGADDFVPYPLPEGALDEVIDRFRTAEDLAEKAPAGAGQSPARPTGDRDGVILPVHGLAGGVGATNFAVNLAWELVASSKNKEDPTRVCLLDFDFQFGSTSTYLDLARKDSVYELLADTSSMDTDSFMQALQVYNDRLHVLTAPADVLPLDIVGPEDIERMIEVARLNFDFVVIDMPTTLVAWSESVMHAAHVYFALMELDMRSAQNALRLIRAMKSEDLPLEKVRFALNRAPKFTDMSGKARVKRMAESLDIDIELLLPDGLKQVDQACDHGTPIAEIAGKNPLRKEIQKLAISLHDITHSEQTGI
ncbi:AAA family ATPase [Actibacterium sp. 188UL27-1]|uniref:AAA family ATPase n=1 Tax=Actibacterium sp. 188UL27-1 TaxID=2786961 RepID=UPI00195D6202|nr:AAA family ATPase [Actibacterium sp. 188UL27-1]MBM7068209.1 AAA family ATPase [Actibacterium sp. 188UL27-1]